MKRINVHLTDETISGLDQIKNMFQEHRIPWDFTRADLIRYALQKTFCFGWDGFDYRFERLDEAISKFKQDGLINQEAEIESEVQRKAQKAESDSEDLSLIGILGML